MSLTAYDLTKTSGCLLKNEVTTLKEIVSDLPQNPVIVNIGTGRGISVLAMLEERNDATIFTVDVSECPQAFENLRRSGQETRRVIPVLGSSAEVGEHCPLEVDAVFVDGDHHYKAVCEDVRAWLPKIKSGGIIIFHDHSPPSPRKQTSTQLQKEAWVTQAVDEMLGDKYEVVVHADRIKAFRV